MTMNKITIVVVNMILLFIVKLTGSEFVPGGLIGFGSRKLMVSGFGLRKMRKSVTVSWVTQEVKEEGFCVLNLQTFINGE